jgi:hypothetical protein
VSLKTFNGASSSQPTHFLDFSNMNLSLQTASFPDRFVDLKREIASSHPDFQERLTNAWVDVLEQLEKTTNRIISEGPSVSILSRP